MPEEKKTVATAAAAYADACKQLEAIEDTNKDPPRIEVTAHYPANNIITHYLKPYLPQAQKAATEYAKEKVATAWQALEDARKREAESGGVELKVIK